MLVSVGLLFVASLGLLHLFSGSLRWIDRLPAKQWFSFGAGVSIAYVFVDVLPFLGRGQTALDAHSGPLAQVVPYLVYVVALLGLTVFYSLEVLAKRSREENVQLTREDCTTPAVFWVHTGAFALYNGLLGYLLSDAEHHGLVPCALLFFALALHFTVNDHAFRSHHKTSYDRYGRWILAFTVVAGYLIGVAYQVGEAAIALLWAFVAGGLILNVIKDELPGQHQSSLSAFLVGLGAYSALLLAVAH